MRHAPGIASADWLWNGLRRPYQRLLNWRGHGVAITLSDNCTVRMPAEYTGASWESYEKESVRAAVSWARRHPDGLVLDVGSAIGFYSLVGLFSSPRTQVIAFDPDLASLKATRRMCHWAAGQRLSLIHGFLSDNHVSGHTFSSATAHTEANLKVSPSTGDPGTNSYICLGKDVDPAIPIHSLDGLLRGSPFTRRPILLKCDVEGAEMLVLEGAQHLLKEAQVDLLLSVHPPALPIYGHSEEQIRQFLDSVGYRVRIISKDHEEHWWCEKPNSSARVTA